MLSKDAVKSGLQRVGLFPIVRSAYRKLSTPIQAQHRKELSFYAGLLKPAGLVFDVGANLGQRSEVFLELGNKVVAVEPNAACQPTLRHLFGSNQNFTLVEKAIGHEVGSVTFYASGTDSTGSTRPDWNTKVFGSDRGQIARVVPMTTLDALVSEYGIPDFVKIDVEGFEQQVIRGLSRALPLLSIEFHHDELDKTRTCLDRLASFGSLLVRPCSMDCDWLLEQSSSVEETMSKLHAMKAKGDLFVWNKAN